MNNQMEKLKNGGSDFIIVFQRYAAAEKDDCQEEEILKDNKKLIMNIGTIAIDKIKIQQYCKNIMI